MHGRISFRLFSNAAMIASVSQPVNRMVTVEWSDGVKGKFPVTWLRDCSLDPKTYSISPAMIARNLTMNEFDVEQSPKSVRLENGQLVIDWEETQSRFDSDWLRLRNPSDSEARELRRRVYLFPETTWGRDDIESGLKRFDHNAVLTDDKDVNPMSTTSGSWWNRTHGGLLENLRRTWVCTMPPSPGTYINWTLHDFLEAVCMDGIAVIQNGPTGTKRAVPDIGERIGLIHNTHFGRIFEVSTKPDASNMAYASSSGLPFHTDFPSLSHPPQLQMLHMIERAEKGGNSLFVDGFHVAEQLRREKPDAFKTLSECSLEFIEEGFDVHDGSDGKPKRFDYNMCARHRTIKLDEKGRVIKIQFGNAMRSWFFDCEPERIQDIYRALKEFTIYCYQEKNILKFALQNGDTVLWANTRLLHTRDDYRNAPNNNRTLTGCYFSWDIVKSKVRHLRRKLGLPSAQPSA